MKRILALLAASLLFTAPAAAQPEEQVSLLDMGAAQAAARLRDVDVNVLTPIEAMNLLYELKQML